MTILFPFCLQQDFGNTYFLKEYLFTKKKTTAGVIIILEITTKEYVCPCKNIYWGVQF